MEIKIKKLKKTVEVKASIKNLKKSYKFAKNMAEAEEKIPVVFRRQRLRYADVHPADDSAGGGTYQLVFRQLCLFLL